MKKKLKIIIGILVAIIFIIPIVLIIRILFPASIKDTTVGKEDEARLIVGALPNSNKGSYYACYTDTGVFLTENNLMQYFEYDSKKTYALCSKSNCSHITSSCPARCDGLGSVIGLANVQGTMYAFFLNRETNTYDLMSFDLTGENRKLIASIDLKDVKEEGWILSDISGVFYYGNMVWYQASWTYYQDGKDVGISNRCSGINMSTGEQFHINDLDLNHSDLMDPYSFQAIAGSHVVVQDYVDKSIILFSVEDQSKKVFTHQELFDSIQAVCPQMNDYESCDVRVRGWMDEPNTGFFQVYCNQGGKPVRHLLLTWDLTGTPKLLADFPKGGTVRIDTSIMGSSIIDKHDVLYAIDQSDTKTMIYRLNLITGESTELFEDEIFIEFRILYDTKDFYIGTLDEGKNFCMISKEDYNRGNLSAARNLSWRLP